MKRFLTGVVVMLMAVAIAVPAMAAVDFKYGGEFRARWFSSNNIRDGQDALNGQGLADDNLNKFDQRLRLFFTFIASENLKLVTRFEAGDTTWGNGSGVLTGAPGNQQGRFGDGGRVGADAVALEVKNIFVEFKIPQTPTTAIIGIQPLNLLSQWIVNDDFSAAVFKSKLDPFTVTVGYVAAQNDTANYVMIGGVPVAKNGTYDDAENIDDFFLSIDYSSGPFSGSLIGFMQDAHDTTASMFAANFPISPSANPIGVPVDPVTGRNLIDGNMLFDLGLNLTYKQDAWSAYLNFAKNFGSADQGNLINNDYVSRDYTGWMIDVGMSYFCGPYTFNLGGFYTSGYDFQQGGNDLDGFTYPYATTKYFSEIVGGGILDSPDSTVNMGQWRGYPFPTNLWTVTAGGAWQVMEKTKLSLSYWYFGSSEDVLADVGRAEWDSSIGHELDFYVTQGIVDGLTLDVVAAYLFTGDAYSPLADDDDVYELGAQLRWAF